MPDNIGQRDVDIPTDRIEAVRPATADDIANGLIIFAGAPDTNGNRRHVYKTVSEFVRYIVSQLEPYISVLPSYEISIGENNEMVLQYNTRGRTFTGWRVDWYDNIQDDGGVRNVPVPESRRPTNVTFSPAVPVVSMEDQIAFLNFTARESGSLSVQVTFTESS